MKQVNICIIGTGYVGLVSGACLAETGHRVVCVDSDHKKIDMLEKGIMPIYEPGLEEVVKRNVKEGRLFFSRGVQEGVHHKGIHAQAVFIAVGTPPRADGSADLSYVEAVTREIAQSIKEYTVIVEKSTVPVETGSWIYKTAKRFIKDGISFDVVSNPEFLREGAAVGDFLHPDRVVVGVNSEKAKEVMRQIYEPLNAPILFTDVKSSELIKHASNSFLATKISFINAVANLCEKTGANIEDVSKGMGMDKRIGESFLKAGIGFGGFCFPKDLEAFYWISKKVGYDFDLLRNVTEINKQQKMWPVHKAEEELWNLEGKTVALLGLAFKPNTDDMRFAPSIDIVNALKERRAVIKTYDPISMENAKHIFDGGVEYCADAYDCVKDADCALLITEWKDFAGLDFERVKQLMKHPILIDGRNLYSPEKLRELGFTYISIGRR